MTGTENPQAIPVSIHQSVVFKAWKKLLAKRKDHFSIKVLCVVLISVATLMVWAIQLSLALLALLSWIFEEASREAAEENPENSLPQAQDCPRSNYSMSLNGQD